MAHKSYQKGHIYPCLSGIVWIFLEILVDNTDIDPLSLVIMVASLPSDLETFLSVSRRRQHFSPPGKEALVTPLLCQLTFRRLTILSSEVIGS